MSTSEDLKRLVAAGRPLIEQALDLADEFKEISESARGKGIDWTQLKALLKAQVQDERGGGTRVRKLVEKAEYACSYADMLGLDTKMNENSKTRSSSSNHPLDIPPDLART